MKTSMILASISRLCAWAAVMATACTAVAQPVEIRLASILPQGVPQHFVLKKLNEDWQRVSGGTVKIRLVDGQSDGESGIVRKMNANVYHAGMLSAVGLTEIEAAVSALQLMPLVFQTWEEVDYVREKLRGQLEDKLLAKGYVTLFWGDAGWVNFFSRQKGIVPSDFKKMKLFAWAGDSRHVEVMKKLGYQPIALETGDILSSFSSKMIDAAPIPPLFALAAQVNTVTEHLLEVNWVPIVGATVVKKQTWEKIPVETRKKLMEFTGPAGEKIRMEGRKAHDEAVRSMKSRGLQVHRVGPEQEKEWRKFAEELVPEVRGRIVPAPIFDEVQRLLKELRASKGGAK